MRKVSIFDNFFDAGGHSIYTIHTYNIYTIHTYNILTYPMHIYTIHTYTYTIHTYTCTYTYTYRDLIGIWEDVLMRKVSIFDNFFDVGGHSIAATKVTFQIRRKLKMDLPLNLLYTFPNIDSLVQQINLNDADPTADFNNNNNGRSNSPNTQSKTEQEQSGIYIYIEWSYLVFSLSVFVSQASKKTNKQTNKQN